MSQNAEQLLNSKILNFWLEFFYIMFTFHFCTQMGAI